MTIIRHTDQPETSGYRQIIGKPIGAHSSTLWDQILLPGGGILSLTIMSVRKRSPFSMGRWRSR